MYFYYLNSIDKTYNFVNKFETANVCGSYVQLIYFYNVVPSTAK